MQKFKINIFDNITYTTIESFIKEFESLEECKEYCYLNSNYYVKLTCSLLD